MDYTSRIISLTNRVADQAAALKATNEEIDAMRSLPAGTTGVPQALNTLNATRKRQHNTLATSQAHLGLLESLQEREATKHAKKPAEQTPKRA